MPIKQKYEQLFTFQDIDKVSVLALCYQIMKNLELNVFSAASETLIGTTPES